MMSFKSWLLGVVAVAMSCGMSVAAESDKRNVLEYTLNSIEGDSVDLSKYAGKVVLVVNVASKCGYTSQYAGLQELHEKYAEKGLVVLGFPCNQFGGQEPGTNKEIQEFCSSKYKVTFDMFDKVDVKGANASPFFKALTSADAKPKGAGDVSWNFEKFLINKNGELVGRYASKVTPMGDELIGAIEAALAE